jgi:hypothetical protein
MSDSTEVVLYIAERGPVTPTTKRINHFLLVNSYQLTDGTYMLQRAKGTQDFVLTLPSDTSVSTLTVQATYQFVHATPATMGSHAVRDVSHVFIVKRASGSQTPLTVLDIEGVRDILGEGTIRTNMNVTLGAIAVAATSSTNGDLTPFVARQLLDLAILRREQCPITVEDYAVGHAAVLPCGHLFMRAALEECFKKDAGTCPACRSKGRPTYV